MKIVPKHDKLSQEQRINEILRMLQGLNAGSLRKTYFLKLEKNPKKMWPLSLRGGGVRPLRLPLQTEYFIDKLCY